MHKIAIPEHALANIRARRGGELHIYERLDAAKTVLVVIDMQKYFVEPGMAGEVPVARRIKGSQYVLVPDSGHLVNLEQPEPFEAAVAGFLAEHAGLAG